jgi:hypothetical protein
MCGVNSHETGIYFAALCESKFPNIPPISSAYLTSTLMESVSQAC